MKNFKAARVLFCITGILMVILGIATLFMPVAAMLTIAIFLGSGFLVAGIFSIISFFADRDILPSPGWVLAEGILDVFIGIILLCNIGAAVLAIPFIVAFWMMFSGIGRIAFSFEIKKFGAANWRLTLITGILALLLSVMIIFWPAAGAAAAIILIGSYLIVYGIVIFVEAIMLKIKKA